MSDEARGAAEQQHPSGVASRAAARAEEGAGAPERKAEAPDSKADISAAGPVVLRAGQVIQGFEILKPLGKGKFSIVYMAKRLTDGLLCALKKINIFDIMQPKQREKCLKEVRLLESLDHPNIVKLLCSFVDSNELLIIVEWAEKGDLKRLIRKALQSETRFSEPECWQYGRQLLGALDHMHQKRIMHRDLKPANIFVSLDGSLKLGDLGLGRFFSSHTLEAFSKVGTPLYMSPEVLRGAGYDMRSDVWSLGCVLYELVMLRSPFKSDQQVSLYDLFVRISKGQYPPMPDTLSIEFRTVVNGMLELEPAKRLDSSQALQACVVQCKKLGPRASGSGSREARAERRLSEQRQPSRPSPLLVMDDIVEKLKLLECEERFLRPRGFPMLHRCFFTMDVPMQRFTQLQVMYELIMWLLTMLKERDDARQEARQTADASAGPCVDPRRRASNPGSSLGAGDAAAGGVAPLFQDGKVRDGFSEAEAARLAHELAARLEGRGIEISDSAMAQLQQGWGESVCFIVNELINLELTGRHFHFKPPAWAALEVEQQDDEEVAEDEELVTASGRSGEESTSECEGPGGAHQPGALEPIYHPDVDADAWRAEVERVIPRLRLSPECLPEFSCEWRGTMARAAKLSRECSELCTAPLMLEGLHAHASRVRHDLTSLRGHEDRLSATFLDAAAEASRLCTDAESEAQRLAALRESVERLSEELSQVTEHLQAAEAEAAIRSEILQSTEKLSAIRKSVQRIRGDNKNMEVRLKYLQGQLLQRHHGVGGLPAKADDVAWGVGDEWDDFQSST